MRFFSVLALALVLALGTTALAGKRSEPVSGELKNLPVEQSETAEEKAAKAEAEKKLKAEKKEREEKAKKVKKAHKGKGKSAKKAGPNASEKARKKASDKSAVANPDKTGEKDRTGTEAPDHPKKPE